MAEIKKETPIDQMIEAFWDLCGEWTFWDAGCDQWWMFAVHCLHGRWSADSQHATDLSTAIIDVYNQAKAVHDNL